MAGLHVCLCCVPALPRRSRETVRQELADNIKRLRHHASLGLWCGNNEMEWQVDDGTWTDAGAGCVLYGALRVHHPGDGLKIRPEHVLLAVSPSCGGGFDNP